MGFTNIYKKYATRDGISFEIVDVKKSLQRKKRSSE